MTPSSSLATSIFVVYCEAAENELTKLKFHYGQEFFSENIRKIAAN